MMEILSEEPRFRDAQGISRRQVMAQCTLCGRVIRMLLRAAQTNLSCGCLPQKRNRTHGESSPGRRTREYRAWTAMRSRCTNPNASDWHHYGGRGIRVCDRWMHSYESFLADVGRAPSQAHTIDRIDPNGHYEPSNVRWATRAEQSLNKRNTVIIGDGSETVEQISARLGIRPQCIRQRRCRGWTDTQLIRGFR